MARESLPDWDYSSDGSGTAVPVETNSAIVSDAEKAAMLAEVEAVGNGVSEVSEQLETLGPIAATLYSELPEAEVDALLDEFDELPQETREWVESVVLANRHASLKRLAKLLKGKATLEHAAAMRAVGW